MSHIELNRTFYLLSSDYTHFADTDDLDIKEALGLRIGNATGWNDLLKLHRVILIAEAGSGKTEEIRQTSLKLRSEGKPAFFIRLEHIPTGMEEAFEEGSYEEFQAWLISTDEGWLFLDSVDEARLREPKDFERAIRKIASHLSAALQRVHIVITGRANAWRAKTDLALCKKYIPYITPIEKERSTSDNEESISVDEAADSEYKQSQTKSNSDSSGFYVYSLSNLSAEQIKIFVQEKGISNSSEFLDDIERYDAWAYTTRPQDLDEIVAFWNKNGRVGTRLELMQHSIERRLNERDQDRAESESITSKKLREGAKLIAAATTFMHKSTIRIPDGGNDPNGIDTKTILAEWDDRECLSLLGRPIFDEALYGTVRYYHRSVREFLTAEWLLDLLKKGSSRRNIEALFFREQYGIQVISPSMKPILSWLVIFDEKIRHKVFNIEPEIIIEGGDPNILPPETRREILKLICHKIASDSSNRFSTDYASVQRFANSDMSDAIKSLFVEYEKNSDVIYFLLRMIWQGRIKQGLPEAKAVALDYQAEKYSRIAAIRAIKEIATQQEHKELLQSFLLENAPFDREILSEFIELLNSSEESIIWVFKALEKVAIYEKYSTDGLCQALENLVERLTPDLLVKFLNSSITLLDQEPVIERRFCEISEHNSWLMVSCAKAIEKLIKTRHALALAPDCLSLLTKMPVFQQYHDLGHSVKENIFQSLVSEWNDLNHALFWNGVGEKKWTPLIGQSNRFFK